MQTGLTYRDVDVVLRSRGVEAWGVASNQPPMPMAPHLPSAVSLLVRFDPAELEDVEHGPTQAYYEGYRRVNAALDAAASALVDVLRAKGHRAESVARDDQRRGVRIDRRLVQRAGVRAQDRRHTGGSRLDRQDGPLRVSRPGSPRASGHGVHRPCAGGRSTGRGRRLRLLPSMRRCVSRRRGQGRLVAGGTPARAALRREGVRARDRQARGSRRRVRHLHRRLPAGAQGQFAEPVEEGGRSEAPHPAGVHASLLRDCLRAESAAPGGVNQTAVSRSTSPRPPPW